ncbi:MAG: DEAD/DEAH box helicase [Deltaproteobacteria bacterium]|nr:DEAD/DEAH box helicase [Deltaproteobacteria bacterium]
MDVFALRKQLIDDYASYVGGFLRIHDDKIKSKIEEELADGLLWPEPLVQLNPTFEPGGWIEGLTASGTLEDECRRIFRVGKGEPSPDGRPMRLHKHQVDAIHAAKTGENYVLTTGTGSGKSLAYIVPIVDHVLRTGSGKGIQAIIVYPMNALANSQEGELRKFLCKGYPDGKEPVTFRRYTGQEKDEERQQIIANPPDILLTNYVMLELLLTRPYEKGLVEAARGLRFLVLDELHTYRGRQGADVGMLVRRVRDACDASKLQCIGTSATLAGQGTREEQQAEVARVAGKLFGAEVSPQRVIGETLRRATPAEDLTAPEFLARLRTRVADPGKKSPAGYSSFVEDPLSVWIETTFGVIPEEGTGRLIRTKPRPISGPEGAAATLAGPTGLPVERCQEAIQEALLAGYQCKNPDTGFSAFAFRLHQFISKGDTVYASPEDEDDRYITVEGQQFVPGERERILIPLAFCRECGQEYFSVWREDGAEGVRLTARMPDDRTGKDDAQPGYLYLRADSPWPTDDAAVRDLLPEDMLELHRGEMRVKPSQRQNLPQPVFVRPDGTAGTTGGGTSGHYLPGTFRFCLKCGVSHGSRRRSDFAALSTLGTEGRSTATTVLSLSAIRHLRREGSLPEHARKLLSFTDNRQDASLQAGHFNDFVEVGLLRSGLHKAVDGGGDAGLEHHELIQRVFDALALPFDQYAVDPTVRFQAETATKRALREVLGYRLFYDLRRGWRVIQPNLEQCGLLHIAYPALEDVCRAEDLWQGGPAALVSATPEIRFKVCRVLLDYMRRGLAIKVDFLRAEYQEQIKQQSSQRLRWPWAIDENERLVQAGVCYPRPRQEDDYGGDLFVSAKGLFGQSLRRPGTLDFDHKLSLDETDAILQHLFGALRVGGLVEIVREPGDENDVPGYQMPADAMVWKGGDGSQAFHDPLQTPRAPEGGIKPNPFFVHYYRTLAYDAKGIEAREHTAQVQYEDREEREQRFRTGNLPVMFCSPTMELGVDISELNTVNMRNVPPTPANYAQRSGRAGRSGQPALVFTYCSIGSSHDQYFFKRPELMVSGAVSPPRLDLANEDLVRSHVQALWLAETGMSLGTSLRDLLEVSGEKPTLALEASIQDQLQAQGPKDRARARADRILGGLSEELSSAYWYSDGWLADVLTQIPNQFEQACERWRQLYRAALSQQVEQNRVANDASRLQREREEARRLRREAETQLELLLQSGSVMQSDFYSYRYFAGEGFLPGYNFPRLPLSAFIPGSRRKTGHDEFISRPRFLAISEFGPRSFLYHEGSKYVIHKAILPAREGDQVGSGKAKQCGECGYLHPVMSPTTDAGPDLCERCGRELRELPLGNLFRLQNVATKRRERINSDEEERLRQGYEIKSGFRFAEHGGRPGHRTAEVLAGGEPLAQLTYGHGANLWRINLGWKRRANPDVKGFVLDVEKGYWSSEGSMEADDDNPVGPRHERVIPYVEDHKNCLLLEPDAARLAQMLKAFREGHAHYQRRSEKELQTMLMASLQAALKSAVQVLYQLEENEIAVEALPAKADRKVLLFYEAAEGGAGVLRRLVDEPDALSAVAREALTLCHFDPDTGEDKRRAPRAREDCEAACYDCLMTYSNQTDHEILDRQLVKETLQRLAAATVKAAPTARPRAEHLEQLKKQAGSGLEKQWLEFLDRGNYRLPTRAQVFLQACQTRPDFFYDGDYQTAVYVDGPPHQYAARRERDRKQTEAMEDLGILVVRFGVDDDWGQILAKYPHIFGKVS